jgi:adenylosuccinate synthase
LDVLDDQEVIKVCVGYKHNGRMITEFPHSIKVLRECEPVYETFEGWKESISHIKSYSRLPEKAKRYLSRIEELAETKIGLISVGPNRDQTIIIDESLVFKKGR